MQEHDKPEAAPPGGAAGEQKPKAEQQSYDVWTSGPEVGKGAARPATGGAGKPPHEDVAWERDVLNRLAFAALNEQRRTRRWGIFFKFLLFIYLFALLFYVPLQWDSEKITVGKHTALVELDGVISSDGPASADHIVSGLRAAFEDSNTVGVILRINSPGGSPVQSDYIFDEIKRLRGLYPDIKLYAVITDMCASGGYYVAAAADEIYANKSSIVGSIGVLMNGFGFVGGMEKLGIERRLLTAGEHKGLMDPFSPLKGEDVRHVQGLLNNVHQQFIAKVKAGRGERLSDSPDLFTGLFWDGEQGLKLGLIDGFGSSSYVAREIIGAERIVDYTPREDFLEQFADRFGAAMASALSGGIGMSESPLR
jgi:protease-4